MAEPVPVDVAVASAHLAVTGIIALVERGVDSVAPTPCEQWDVYDLICHLEAIAGAYVLWTSAAIGGRVGDLRVGTDLAAYNQELVDRLPRRGITRHTRMYEQLAADHLRLVEAFPDAPMLRTPSGDVWTVAQHAGVAALEWHIHAWDLSRAADTVYVPDAAPLARAWSATIGASVGPPLDEVPEDNGAAWAAVLRASGRTP